MPPKPPQPIIVEPKTPETNPADGKFSLYDTDFPVEKLSRYAVSPGTPPLRRPHFPLGEVASWVFGRSSQWLKTQLKGYPYQRVPLRLPDGQPLVFRIVPKGRTGERRFTLPDIERLAWALYQRGSIDGTRLQHAHQIILAAAEQHKTPEED